MNQLIQDNRIFWPPKQSGRPRVKRYQQELSEEFTGLTSVPNPIFSAQGTRQLRELFNGSDVFDFPKPVEYIKLIIEQATEPNESNIVLDFFAGSSTTARASGTKCLLSYRS